MSEDRMGYNAMVEGAMLNVVRKAIETAATEGLPGEHHFYITFRTDHPDSQLPDHLRKRYPREMTIVLQHQFWNLTVDEHALEVDLSFNQKLERLRVPLDALITFADPSVNFGLQFHPSAPEQDDVDGASDADREDMADGGAPQNDTEIEGEAPSDSDGDNVVTLDAFRKK